MLNFENRLINPVGDNDIGPLGLDALAGKPISQPIDKDAFKAKLNEYLDANYSFRIGNFQNRSMRSNFALGINEYVASCNCAGNCRTGLKAFMC
jgi:hypothetical protein